MDSSEGEDDAAAANAKCECRLNGNDSVGKRVPTALSPPSVAPEWGWAWVSAAPGAVAWAPGRAAGPNSEPPPGRPADWPHGRRHSRRLRPVRSAPRPDFQSRRAFARGLA